MQHKYNDAGDLRYRRDARQNAQNRVSFTYYDGFGRLVRVGEAGATATA